MTRHLLPLALALLAATIALDPARASSRNDLIMRVAQETGLSTGHAAVAIDAVLAGVAEALARGDAVGLADFSAAGKSLAADAACGPQAAAPIAIPVSGTAPDTAAQ